jgi:hypothetical protein
VDNAFFPEVGEYGDEVLAGLEKIIVLIHHPPPPIRLIMKSGTTELLKTRL